ncbi:hypothetical protein PM082_003537 [Marasmius tenuissimus]|nr:hypothetical protein PM082_003537 [Marasmius tenuissimus]
MNLIRHELFNVVMHAWLGTPNLQTLMFSLRLLRSSYPPVAGARQRSGSLISEARAGLEQLASFLKRRLPWDSKWPRHVKTFHYTCTIRVCVRIGVSSSGLSSIYGSILGITHGSATIVNLLFGVASN